MGQDGSAGRIHRSVQRRIRLGDFGGGKRRHVGRRERLGEELVNATVVAGGVEEERRPDRSALAARAVGVGGVGRTARGDRGAERVLDDAEAGVRDAGRRVELEDRGAGPTLEVADEGHLRLGHLLLPGDVGHVAGERDVGSGRVVHRVRDGLAGVEELEMVAADQS